MSAETAANPSIASLPPQAGFAGSPARRLPAGCLGILPKVTAETSSRLDHRKIILSGVCASACSFRRQAEAWNHFFPPIPAWHRLPIGQAGSQKLRDHERITAEQVHAALRFPDFIDALHATFAGHHTMPPRQVFLLDEASGGHDAFAMLPSWNDEVIALKAFTYFPDNQAPTRISSAITTPPSVSATRRW